MSAIKKILPSQPRGINRLSQPILDQDYWMINQKRYSFLGAFFDSLTALQLLTKIKCISQDHGFRYILTSGMDQVVKINKHADRHEKMHSTCWLNICNSRTVDFLAKLSGIPIGQINNAELVQQIFDNVITKKDSINIIYYNFNSIKQFKSCDFSTRMNYHQLSTDIYSSDEAINIAAEFVHKNQARYTFICAGSPIRESIAKQILARGNCRGLGICIDALPKLVLNNNKASSKKGNKRSSYIIAIFQKAYMHYKYAAKLLHVLWYWFKTSIVKLS
ncbi:MAG: hypothetical protein P8N18_06995 [Hellea sp.]|nr:hypothetical protein [Hellea sp.]